MISILGGQIHKLIIEEIGSGPYSIIIDETTDLSRDEQVAFCIRYVYKGQIKERFVKFNTTASTRSADLEQIVLRHLRELGLSGNFIVGQSYDGASNMSGIYTGLAARLREKFKTAIYIHCYDHRLNLSIKDACSQVSEIRNALGTLNSMHSFIEGSAKRHDIFKGIATLEDCYIALKHLCETRWASRKRSVSAMKTTFSAVLKSLKHIDEVDKSPAGANANSLLKAASQFEYLFVIYLLDEIFNITGGLSQALQEIKLDVISAQNLIESTIKALENLNNVDKFDSIYNLCIDFAKENEIDLPKLKRQANKPARFREVDSTSVVFSTPVEKYQSLFFQTLNITMEEIKSRFSKDSINPIIEMADILKNASVESTDSLDGRSIYNVYFLKNVKP
jgi:hypothetical protein